MERKTVAIGDIHGELAELKKLWQRLPELSVTDTIIFLGDYIDRGPDACGVIEFIRALPLLTPARVITLMGNHERMLLDAYEKEEYSPLLPAQNGCEATYRSFIDQPSENAGELLMERLQVRRWLPVDVYQWMKELPRWYEDEHAIYVHAGLEGEGKIWFHPTESKEGALLWMREDDFWTGYAGKRLVFGHTVTSSLPCDHMNWLDKQLDDKRDVWFRGDLIGIDTGCGKGGFLTAVVLPEIEIYESR